MHHRSQMRHPPSPPQPQIRAQPQSQAAITRYLERHAEPQAEYVCDGTLAFSRVYPHVLVIPAFDEPADCIDLVLAQIQADVLVIVVVNGAVDSDRAAIARTQICLNAWMASGQPAGLVPYRPTIDVLVVDCCTAGRQLPAKQGVGLARKIGGDVALACMAEGVVRSPWLHYTDADVVLPPDYFDPVSPDLFTPDSFNPDSFNPDITAALIYPFCHQPPHEAILLYELSLRYYVLQLEQARSPYAFHTIGSLLCISASHYAKVRGFPKRNAAEDFYMLNKLAKTGAIVRLTQPTVTLASRVSHRVPFGTGAMMTRLAQAPAFHFYHPTIFQQLHAWNTTMDGLWQPSVDSGHRLQTWLQQHHGEEEPCWLPGLVAMGLESLLEQAHRQSHDLPHFRRFLWTWFDAFRTLKLVHYLRDHHYPSVAADVWVREMTRSPHSGDTVSLETMSLETITALNQRLVEAEKALPSMVERWS